VLEEGGDDRRNAGSKRERGERGKIGGMGVKKGERE